MNGNFPLLPPEASNFAGQIDAITLTLTLISTLLTLPIIGLIIYFCVRYRRGSKASRAGWRPGHALEWGWIGGLLVLVVPIFIWTSHVYLTMWRPPPTTTEVYVVARQWMWKTQYPNGRREINQLHVPLGRPVRLIMTSEDVIHSFYVPDFRVKHDVLPGRYSSLWFTATQEGEFHLYCAEYCGLEHSNMGGTVVVMKPADFQDWLNKPAAAGPAGSAADGGGNTPASMAQTGAQLFSSQGCISCHKMDGSGVAPSLVGVFGSDVPLQGGLTVRADEDYIRTSIVRPNAQVVAGYQSIMPTFEGKLSEEQIMALLAYIKSLQP